MKHLELTAHEQRTLREMGKISQVRAAEPLAHRQRINVLELCAMIAS